MKRNIAWFAASAAALALLYAPGVNRNLFYLMFSLSCAGLIVVLAQRARIRLAALALLLVAATVSVSAPLPRRVQVDLTYENSLKEYPAQARMIFRFELTELEKRSAECGGLQPYAMIVGRNLQTLDITANGKPPVKVDIVPVNERLLMMALLPEGLGSTVTLRLDPREPFMLHQGPEVMGLDAYPDGVYLRFQSPKCHVVYHAKRTRDD